LRALILTPTRELAAQVHENLRAYGRHLNPKSAEIFGGVNINPQITKLKRGVDVLIATPGRLIDHMERGTIDLDAIETLILDEADRMLDMGFRPAIDRIVKALPKQRQTCCSRPPSRRKSPRWQALPQQSGPSGNRSPQLHRRRHRPEGDPVDQKKKRELLSWMIGSKNWRQVLVFTRTKHGANRLAKQLEIRRPAGCRHSWQQEPGRAHQGLADFKANRIRVLVATDIAARGLDIDQLPHVVNYDIPNVPEDYVHRIGRTGRAGRDGLAVSLVSGAEHGLFEDIRKLVKSRFQPKPSTATSRPSRCPGDRNRRRNAPASARETAIGTVRRHRTVPAGTASKGGDRASAGRPDPEQGLKDSGGACPPVSVTSARSRNIQNLRRSSFCRSNP
jgi:ATP-dependent RNA helicase RhlE